MKLKCAFTSIFVLSLGILISEQSKPKKEGAPTMNPNEVTVRLLNDKGELTPPARVPKVVKTSAEWRKILTDEQFQVTRTKGTERPFCGVFHDNKKKGIYSCVGCALPLFRSDAKFDSGTGWPSFFQPIADENVAKETDAAHGMVRTEILCARCDAHLGHVFNDGPKPTRLRFCLNSAAMTFSESGATKNPAIHREQAMFGAGCFWGVEETFRQLKGVTKTSVYRPCRSCFGRVRSYPSHL
jgi:methionine-R-sulfoxide reductase